MYIIVGLGNPGDKYRNTKHNVGFAAIDTLADKHKIKVKKLKFKSLMGEGNIFGEKVVLLKPQTFMNQSGESVSLVKEYYKVEDDRIVIVYDDTAFDIGDVRIKPFGSDGGHNGMKSVIYMLKSDAFPRVRIGIGAKTNDNMVLADHVLSSFSNEDTPLIKEGIMLAVMGVEGIIKNGIDAAMNEFNRRAAGGNTSHP